MSYLMPDHPDIAKVLRDGYLNDEEYDDDVMPDGWHPDYGQLIDYAEYRGTLTETLHDTLEEDGGLNWTLYDILENIRLNVTDEEVWDYLGEKK